MTARITEQGLLLPRELFAPSVEEVEIRRDGDDIYLIPVHGDTFADAAPPAADDPIWQIGENPVDDPLTDASTQLDRHLYDGR